MKKVFLGLMTVLCLGLFFAACSKDKKNSVTGGNNGNNTQETIGGHNVSLHFTVTGDGEGSIWKIDGNTIRLQRGHAYGIDIKTFLRIDGTDYQLIDEQLIDGSENMISLSLDTNNIELQNGFEGIHIADNHGLGTFDPEDPENIFIHIYKITKLFNEDLSPILSLTFTVKTVENL